MWVGIVLTLRWGPCLDRLLREEYRKSCEDLDEKRQSHNLQDDRVLPEHSCWRHPGTPGLHYGGSDQ